MDATVPAAPEAIHQEPTIKQEFASFAPWNQFAPDQLVIDSSSDDDESHTDSVNNDQPQTLASFPSSAMDSFAPEIKISTIDTAPCEIGCAGQAEFKQELAKFSKAVKSGLRFVKTPLVNQDHCSEDGVPDILDQLPCLDMYQVSRIWDDAATPMLLPEVQYFIKYWRVAFFAVRIREAEPGFEYGFTK